MLVVDLSEGKVEIKSRPDNVILSLPYRMDNCWQAVDIDDLKKIKERIEEILEGNKNKMIKVTKVFYEISDSLPILETIRNIDDARERYFPNDYHEAEEMVVHNARSCHTKYIPGNYWLQEVEKECSFMKVSAFEVCTLSGKSILEIECKELLSEEKMIHLLDVMESKAKFFLRKKTISFDVNNLNSYKYAKKMNCLNIFEKWLYSDVFRHTKGSITDCVTVITNGDGIYLCDFICDANEEEVKKNVYNFLEDSMINWIDQEITETRIMKEIESKIVEELKK